MKTLSGVLEFSMGNFLCLRGYIDYKTLSAISEENKDVQRELIEKHKGEMAAFLNSGEYRFFPEIVLSVSVLSENNYSEVSDFFAAVSSKAEWNKKLGDISISIYNHKAGDKNRIAHLTIDETKKKLNRIDGNHRLSAASEVMSDFKVPFCLIICQNPDEENRYSRAIFHNINAKQIPLNLEENLKVILSSPGVFSNDKLINDPSFGWKYYLARKTIDTADFSYFPSINSYIYNSKYSFFVDLFGFLINNQSIEEKDESVDIVKRQLIDVERALVESEITTTTSNIAVIGALAYYRLTNESKYRGFLSWVKKNNIGNVEKLHISDVINLYDEIFLHVPKKAFLARWYPSAENDGEDEANRAKHRIEAMKEVADELGLDLTDLGTRETGTFDIREVMYKDIRECDIFIADLTGARHNVMIEVGYALKHVNIGRMLFYFQESDKCKTVPFDVNHLNYIPIVDSGDIRTEVKKRIQNILIQAKNGEI